MKMLLFSKLMAGAGHVLSNLFRIGEVSSFSYERNIFQADLFMNIIKAHIPLCCVNSAYVWVTVKGELSHS